MVKWSNIFYTHLTVFSCFAFGTLVFVFCSFPHYQIGRKLVLYQFNMRKSLFNGIFYTQSCAFSFFFTNFVRNLVKAHPGPPKGRDAIYIIFAKNRCGYYYKTSFPLGDLSKPLRTPVRKGLVRLIIKQKINQKKWQY